MSSVSTDMQDTETLSLNSDPENPVTQSNVHDHVGGKKKSRTGVSRSSLTMQQKAEILRLKLADPSLTYNKLMDIAYTRFGVRPSHSAVVLMFKPEESQRILTWVEEHGQEDCSRSNRVSRVHQLNEALAHWERTVSTTPGTWVTDQELIEKAMELGANMDLPKDFTYSRTNWLVSFKKKVCSKSFGVHSPTP
jgi:hypothetical protein